MLNFGRCSQIFYNHCESPYELYEEVVCFTLTFVGLVVKDLKKQKCQVFFKDSLLKILYNKGVEHRWVGIDGLIGRCCWCLLVSRSSWNIFVEQVVCCCLLLFLSPPVDPTDSPTFWEPRKGRLFLWRPEKFELLFPGDLVG